MDKLRYSEVIFTILFYTGQDSSIPQNTSNLSYLCTAGKSGAVRGGGNKRWSSSLKN